MIMADTGFWLALANAKDKWHAIAVRQLKILEPELITTWPVMTETCHLLLKRLGTPATLAFMRSYEQGAFEVAEMAINDRGHLSVLMQKYSDLPMDLADASLVLLAEKLGHGKILSTDQRDFHSYRWKQHHPFENLLLG